jgi:hypothetical protein
LYQPGGCDDGGFPVSILRPLTSHERFERQFRIDALNALNHPQFGAPGRTPGASDQGVISSLLFNTRCAKSSL